MIFSTISRFMISSRAAFDPLPHRKAPVKTPGFHVDMPAQQEVVHDRGVGEELDVLEGAGDPPAGDAVRGVRPTRSSPSQMIRPVFGL